MRRFCVGIATALVAGSLASASGRVAAAANPMCSGEPATMVGTPGRDRLVGTPKDDVVVALGGNDVILGRDGNDLICAGQGADIVRGNRGGDSLDGEAGRDLVSGGNGLDGVRGGPGRDVERGGRRTDFFSPVMDGEVDSLDGGPGNDFLFFNKAEAPVTVDLERGFARAGDRRDRLALGTFETIYGSSNFADRILGDDESNVLFAGFGSPPGGGPVDILKGRGGNDYLEGYEGDDVLRGGGDDDVIYGGFGRDEVHGGAGIDLIRFCGHFSSTASTCGSGSIESEQQGVTVDLSGGMVNSGEGGTLRGIEDVEGTVLGDSITGSEGANRLYGGPRDDSVSGFGGDDLLVGDEPAPLPAPLDRRIRNDLGGDGDPDGDDELDGGEGTDSLQGDGGIDTCVNGELNQDCEN